MAKPIQRGLRLPPPLQTERDLIRKLLPINNQAVKFARGNIHPLILENRLDEIEAEIQELDGLTADAFDNLGWERSLEIAGARIEKRHRLAFFPAAAAALGVAFLGTDVGPTARAVDPGVPLRPKRGRPQVIVKPSAEPLSLVQRFVTESQANVRRLQSGIAVGLREQISRAVRRSPPAQAAGVLLDKWVQNGMPVRNGTNLNTLPNGFVLEMRRQVVQLNTRLTRERQTAVGFTHFRWTTQGDDRVRDAHEEINGMIFPWDEGAPGEGLPGDPINCRCYATAVPGSADIGAATGVTLSAEQQQQRVVAGSAVRSHGRL